MATPSIANTSATPSASGSQPDVAGLQQQLQVLQHKYADCAGCTSTPTTDKQKQEAQLTQQIARVQARIDHLQRGQQPQAAQAGASAGASADASPSNASSSPPVVTATNHAVGLRPLVDDRA